MALGGTGHRWVSQHAFLASCFSSSVSVSPLPRPVTDTDAPGLRFGVPFSPLISLVDASRCHKSVTVYTSLLNVTLVPSKAQLGAYIVIPNLLCPKLYVSSAPCPPDYLFFPQAKPIPVNDDHTTSFLGSTS